AWWRRGAVVAGVCVCACVCACVRVCVGYGMSGDLRSLVATWPEFSEEPPKVDGVLDLLQVHQKVHTHTHTVSSHTGLKGQRQDSILSHWSHSHTCINTHTHSHTHSILKHRSHSHTCINTHTHTHTHTDRDMHHTPPHGDTHQHIHTP